MCVCAWARARARSRARARVCVLGEKLGEGGKKDVSSQGMYIYMTLFLCIYFF